LQELKEKINRYTKSQLFPVISFWPNPSFPHAHAHTYTYTHTHPKTKFLGELLAACNSRPAKVGVGDGEPISSLQGLHQYIVNPLKLPLVTVQLDAPNQQVCLGN
jgi:hypothetical protein